MAQDAVVAAALLLRRFALGAADGGVLLQLRRRVPLSWAAALSISAAVWRRLAASSI